MRTGLLGAGVLIAWLLWSATTAVAENRQALVIGNDAYDHLPHLGKAINDARSMGEALTRIGFDVEVLEDLDRRSFNAALTRLERRLDKDTTSFVFFAGHGVEIDGANYLIPVDAPLVRPTERSLLIDEAISLGRVLDRLSGAGASIVVLDACRENPFPQVAGRSVGSARGLTYASPPRGTFIVYSAGARQQALDNLGDSDVSPNGVFTRVFLDEFAKPGQSIRSAVVNTRNRVSELARSISHQQFPAYYDQLTRDIVLAELVDEPNCEAARQVWDFVRTSERTADLQAFVDRFDGCFMADLARIRLAELDRPPPPAEHIPVPASTTRPAPEFISDAIPAPMPAPDPVAAPAPPRDPKPVEVVSKRRDRETSASVQPTASPTPDPEPPELSPGPAYAIVELNQVQITRTASNVRAAPTTESAKVAKLRAETRVRATGRLEDGSWLRIALPGREPGWIWAELVDLADPQELAAWRTASKGDLKAVVRFLRRYPRGQYKRTARARLAELKASASRDRSNGSRDALASYDPPGDNEQRSRAFLKEHRRSVETAVREYYREHGTIWDEPSVAQKAEQIYEIRDVKLDMARPDGIDLLIRYRWEGDGIVADAEAKFRMTVTPETLAVTKMWR